MYGETTAHRVACKNNPIQGMAEQHRDLLRHQQSRADSEYRMAEQQTNTTRRQQVRDNRQPSFRALNYKPANFLNTTDIGTLGVQCSDCGALKFEKETDSMCCSKVKVQLDAFLKLQPFLQHLYEGIDSDDKHFPTMTSFGCNEVSMAGFNPFFRIQGQIYHLNGSIVPLPGESPKFAQIYVFHR